MTDQTTVELASFVPDLRMQAITAACTLYQGTRESPRVVVRAAEEFLEFLSAPAAAIRLRPSRFTIAQGDPAVRVPTKITGDGMSVTMTDDQQVTYTAAPVDDKGFPVSDTLTWSASDGGSVVTVTPAADGMSATFAAVAPGSATITVTDGTLSASDLITVTAGTVASLQITPGTPSAETPAAPPATPPAAG